MCAFDVFHFAYNASLSFSVVTADTGKTVELGRSDALRKSASDVIAFDKCPIRLYMGLFVFFLFLVPGCVRCRVGVSRQVARGTVLRRS